MGDEILRRARVVEEREMEFRGHHFRLDALLQLGDLEGVENEIVACAKIASELGQPYYAWQAEAFQAMHLLMQGSYAEAEEAARSALKHWPRDAGAHFELGRARGRGRLTPNEDLRLALALQPGLALSLPSLPKVLVKN
jgi:tetratricopeptide (TPR) repeat protein